MNELREIEQQKEAIPLVLELVKSRGTLSPFDLRIKGFSNYILKRAVWELVEKGQLKFTEDYHITILP